VLELHHQPLANPIKIGNLGERSKLPLLRSLSVSGVQDRNIRCAVTLARYRRRHAGVHAPAQKHDAF
jgi:hypothetical protein